MIFGIGGRRKAVWDQPAGLSGIRAGEDTEWTYAGRYQKPDTMKLRTKCGAAFMSKVKEFEWSIEVITDLMP